MVSATSSVSARNSSNNTASADGAKNKGQERSIIWSTGHATFLLAGLIYFVTSIRYFYRMGMLGLVAAYASFLYRTYLASNKANAAENVLLSDKMPYLFISLCLYLLSPSGGIIMSRFHFPNRSRDNHL